MCFGAIDGSHIPTPAPKENAQDYHNGKGFFFIVLQGTCNFHNKFIDVSVGCPGRCNDCGVYTASSVGKILWDVHGRVSLTDSIPKMFGKYIQGLYARPYIMGDDICPFEVPTAAWLYGCSTQSTA